MSTEGRVRDCADLFDCYIGARREQIASRTAQGLPSLIIERELAVLERYHADLSDALAELTTETEDQPYREYLSIVARRLGLSLPIDFDEEDA